MNAHVEARQAAERIRKSRNGLAGTLHLPEPQPLPWYKRLLEPENLIVAGREVKGIVVTPAMGLTLILALGGLLGAGYKSLASDISEQRKEARESRDLMIEVKTRLEMKDNYDKQEFQKVHDRIQGALDHQAAIESLVNKQFAELKKGR